MAETSQHPNDHTDDSTENRTGTHIEPTQSGITNRPDEESQRQEKVVKDQ